MADKALLCGINNYKTVNDLRGCVNDVADMERLLLEQYHFTAGNIRKLLNTKVTKAQIQTNWKWLLKDAKPGDRLVFHFSGHGSFIADKNDDEEDGYDELHCLYDMAWNNPNSYLLDDDLLKMTRQVPQGVHLTLILDDCHSGSAARVLEVADAEGRLQRVAVAVAATVQRQAADAVTAAADQQLDPEREDTVLARFLPPPPEALERVLAKRMGPKTRAAELKCVALGACQDDQTAADAWIDGGYHGAFTYHLCRELRADPNVGSVDLVGRVAQRLEAAQFDQVPAHDGVARPGPLFGGGAGTPAPHDRPAGDGALADAMRQMNETLRLILNRLDAAPARRRARATGQRYLVYVHGIDRHPPGFSDPWWDALRSYTDAFGAGELGESRREVRWSDLVNPRGLRAARDEGLPREADALRQQILAVIEDRQRQDAARAARAARGARSGATARRAFTRGGGPAIDDFLIYLTNPAVRQQIIDTFTEEVRPLLEEGGRLDVISHSWGTVVAYEALRELEGDDTLTGAVANFFTAGSALSILPVRWGLRSANQDGERPAQVERWINLDAEGDAVGGGLADHFGVDVEELNLEPVGCRRSFGGWGWYDLSCAHGSYFRAANEAVNRDIFARYIND